MTNTQTDEFAPPGTGGDRLPLDDVLGALLLFTVESVEKDIETQFGKSDAIKCDVAALDGNHKAETWDGALIFPRVLQSQLRGAAGGGKVLGRLGKGEAKKGQSAPWVLSDPTDEDKQTARNYLAYVATQTPPSAPF